MLPAAAFLRNEMNPDMIPEEAPMENADAGTAETLNDFGQLTLPRPLSDIHVITVIGQVEGHLVVPAQNKATKYEHIIPQLVAVGAIKVLSAATAMGTPME